MSYQGWANHATWVVHLHLDNDLELHTASKSTINSAKDWDKLLGWEGHPAEALRDFVFDLFDDIDLKVTNPATSMRFDLIQSALNEVDWNSIVEALMEE